MENGSEHYQPAETESGSGSLCAAKLCNLPLLGGGGGTFDNRIICERQEPQSDVSGFLSGSFFVLLSWVCSHIAAVHLLSFHCEPVRTCVLQVLLLNGTRSRAESEQYQRSSEEVSHKHQPSVGHWWTNEPTAAASRGCHHEIRSTKRNDVLETHTANHIKALFQCIQHSDLLNHNDVINRFRSVKQKQKIRHHCERWEHTTDALMGPHCSWLHHWSSLGS